LTDRGTYEALAGSITLIILHEGDPRLLNTYAVIADPKNAAGAAFAAWLAEGSGRDLMHEQVSAGRIRGFSPWPRDAPASTPEAKPR
jgi:ABC-type tungstate transport system permease subunit